MVSATLKLKGKIMTNLNIETKNVESNFTMNEAISKEKFLLAIKDFKEFSANKENGPYRDSEGTKYKGDLRFSTYIFYAMLKNKDIAITTHSTDSDNYKDRLSMLKTYAKDGTTGYASWEIRNEVKLISDCFKSLSKEDIQAVIRHYFK